MQYVHLTTYSVVTKSFRELAEWVAKILHGPSARLQKVNPDTFYLDSEHMYRARAKYGDNNRVDIYIERWSGMETYQARALVQILDWRGGTGLRARAIEGGTTWTLPNQK